MNSTPIYTTPSDVDTPITPIINPTDDPLQLSEDQSELYGDSFTFQEEPLDDSCYHQLQDANLLEMLEDSSCDAKGELMHVLYVQAVVS